MARYVKGHRRPHLSESTLMLIQIAIFWLFFEWYHEPEGNFLSIRGTPDAGYKNQ